MRGGCLEEVSNMRLSMGTSDEIEDATIAINEMKISEIEVTKRRFRQNISQSDLRKLNMKISHLIHNQTWNVEISVLDKKVRKGSKKVRMRDCEKRRFRWKIDNLMKKARWNRRSYIPIERLKYSDLIWEILVFWKTGRWGEVVTSERWSQQETWLYLEDSIISFPCG